MFAFCKGGNVAEVTTGEGPLRYCSAEFIEGADELIEGARGFVEGGVRFIEGAMDEELQSF